MKPANSSKLVEIIVISIAFSEGVICGPDCKHNDRNCKAPVKWKPQHRSEPASFNNQRKRCQTSKCSQCSIVHRQKEMPQHQTGDEQRKPHPDSVVKMEPGRFNPTHAIEEEYAYCRKA